MRFNSTRSLLRLDEAGLYCPMGDFYIDPQKPVERALITHGHSDHARPKMKRYLTSESGRPIVQERVGPAAIVEGLPYVLEVIVPYTEHVLPMIKQGLSAKDILLKSPNSNHS